jgi:hypothetical protein
MERGEAYSEFWWGKVGGRDHSGETGIDWRIIFRWIFRK